MGKTVESYRMALESEINVWNGFARALRSEERQAFEAMMDACRGNASAAGNATRPILFEPMVMSILVGHQKKLRKLEYKLNDVIWQEICAQENNPNVSEKPTEHLPM